MVPGGCTPLEFVTVLSYNTNVDIDLLEVITMPAVTGTTLNQSGVFTPTQITLDGSTDTVVFDPSKNQVLTIFNPTVGAVGPVTITGDANSATFPVPGSDQTVDNTVPLQLHASLPAGEQVSVKLNTIENRLVGAVTLAGGATLVATLEEF